MDLTPICSATFARQFWTSFAKKMKLDEGMLNQDQSEPGP